MKKYLNWDITSPSTTKTGKPNPSLDMLCGLQKSQLCYLQVSHLLMRIAIWTSQSEVTVQKGPAWSVKQMAQSQSALILPDK